MFTDLYHYSSKISLALFNLYVPVNYSEKRECWKSLSEYIESISPSNLVLVGDLNITLAHSEKKGGLCGKDHLQDMVETIILACDLMDIKPKIGRYTWSNNRVGLANISARLDKFLIQSSLLDGQSIISSKILPKLLSDHHPISLIFEKEDELGPIPFRFSPL